jgi:hypothetical protein
MLRQSEKTQQIKEGRERKMGNNAKVGCLYFRRRNEVQVMINHCSVVDS